MEMKLIFCCVLLALTSGCATLHKGDNPAVPAEMEREKAATQREAQWRDYLSAYVGLVADYHEEGDREEMAQDLRLLAREYAGALPEHTPVLLDWAAQLEAMIQEDRAWYEERERRTAEWHADWRLEDHWCAGKSTAELMERYIYLLRDFQHAPTMAADYDFAFFDRIFSDPGISNSENPAKALRTLGRRNIPRLIEMLSDRRLTRCIGYWREFYWETWFLLRNQDVAMAILNSYRETPFYDPSCTGAFFSVEIPEVQRMVIEDVKRWYASERNSGP